MGELIRPVIAAALIFGGMWNANYEPGPWMLVMAIGFVFLGYNVGTNPDIADLRAWLKQVLRRPVGE